MTSFTRNTGARKAASIWLCVTICTAGGCYPEIRGEPGQSPLPLVEVLPLREQPLARSTTLIGTTEPWRESTLYFEVSGVVSEILVEEGDVIEPDAPIAQLVLRDYQLQLAMAQAELEAAQAGLALLNAGTRKEDIKAAKADFDRAQTRATYWKGEWDRYSHLFGSTTVSESDRDRVQNEYNAAVHEERATEARWERAVAGPRREEIDEASATVQARQQALELARRQLEKATLRAPFGGRVEKRMLDPGAYVNVFPMGGVPVVQIIDLEQTDVVFDVPEALLAACSTLETLTVASAVQPNIQVPARVISLGRVADPRSGTYPLRARIASQDQRFPAGMIVTTDIPESAPPAIQIPLSSVAYAYGQPPQVLLVDATTDRVVARPIQLGSVAGDRVEVTGGLSSNELLVVRGQDRVLPGDQVRHRTFTSQPPAPSEVP